MAGLARIYGIDCRNVIQFHAAIERNGNAYGFGRKRGGEFKYGNGGNCRPFGNGNDYGYGNLRANFDRRNHRLNLNARRYNAYGIDVSVATRRLEYRRRNGRNLHIGSGRRWRSDNGQSICK